MYMDLSLGTLVEVEDSQEVQEEDQEDNNLYQQQRALGQDLHHQQDGSGGGPSHGVELEHMFDKVLTPSDVGKLNRLVVPKQHAERFFPAAGAGTQLCFQDRGGALWQFRYSYWGSSQSYVMTKGWSRFVRAARLAAGDTVTFSRGAGGGGRYFIEYRHCQRRRHRRDVDISFGDAATMPAWPVVVGTAAMNGGAAVAAVETAASAAIAGHDVEVAPSGARSFRLFGFNVECSGDDAPAPAPAEVEYVDGDS